MIKYTHSSPKAMFSLNGKQSCISHQDMAQNKSPHGFHYYLALVVLATAIREENTIRGIRNGQRPTVWQMTYHKI